MPQIRILIVDDHKLIREAWSFTLNADPRFEVVGECGDAENAFELCRQLMPDIVMLDINLPGMDGIEAAEKIRKISPDIKILGVSLHTQPSYAKRMMKNGALGYVTKCSSRGEMLEALLSVYQGQKYICRSIKNSIAELIIEGKKETPVNSLSGRELQIIEYIKKGHSSREISNLANISIKTVEVHRYNILKKLNLKNTTELINHIHDNPFFFR